MSERNPYYGFANPYFPPFVGQIEPHIRPFLTNGKLPALQAVAMIEQILYPDWDVYKLCSGAAQRGILPDIEQRAGGGVYKADRLSRPQTIYLGVMATLVEYSQFNPDKIQWRQLIATTQAVVGQSVLHTIPQQYFGIESTNQGYFVVESALRLNPFQSKSKKSTNEHYQVGVYQKPVIRKPYITREQAIDWFNKLDRSGLCGSLDTIAANKLGPLGIPMKAASDLGHWAKPQQSEEFDPSFYTFAQSLKQIIEQ